LAVAATAVLLSAGCGVTVERPGVSYYFSHPILNESWGAGTLRTKSTKVTRAKKKKPSKRQASQAKADPAGKKTPAARRGDSPPPRQALRGNDLRVVRQEVVLSAQRLVGIKDSFTQDTFARHVLMVNNLGLGDVPQDGVVHWLYSMPGTQTRVIQEVQPGDVLFLGEDVPGQCIVVEKVDDGGAVTFIGVISGEVQRGVLSLSNRTARRDETSGKVLNSFVGKGQLAGELLLGGFSLAADGTVAQGD